MSISLILSIHPLHQYQRLLSSSSSSSHVTHLTVMHPVSHPRPRAPQRRTSRKRATVGNLITTCGNIVTTSSGSVKSPLVESHAGSKQINKASEKGEVYRPSVQVMMRKGEESSVGEDTEDWVDERSFVTVDLHEDGLPPDGLTPGTFTSFHTSSLHFLSQQEFY